jgi:hypothetical protein
MSLYEWFKFWTLASSIFTINLTVIRCVSPLLHCRRPKEIVSFRCVRYVTINIRFHILLFFLLLLICCKVFADNVMYFSSLNFSFTDQRLWSLLHLSMSVSLASDPCPTLSPISRERISLRTEPQALQVAIPIRIAIIVKLASTMPFFELKLGFHIW